MATRIETFTAADGTALSYRTVGQGPALIVIPGALSDAEDYTGLAAALTASFTVYTLDRRGRGASGPQGPDYSLAKECDDVRVLQARTGARHLFGHSFGGLVALEAARNNPQLEQVTVYEPGVSIDGSIPLGWAERCRAELAQGRKFDAFVTFARGINPETTGRLPRWAFKLILRLVMRAPERRKKERLLPAAIREHVEAARLDNTYHRYRDISTRVMLLVGGRGVSASGAAHTAAVLATVLPESATVVFPRLDHFGPEQRPVEVAQRLLESFGPRPASVVPPGVPV